MKTLKTLALAAMLASGLAQAKLPDDSLYQLDSHWQNQDAGHFMLPALQGKKQVVGMIYTHCLHTCPMIVANMQSVQKALPEGERDKVGFVLVSLTPDSDTPKVLKDFANKRGLGEDWTLLTGTESDVRALALALNIQYKATMDGEVAHSNAVSVLDEQGRLLFQEVGLPQGAKAMAERVLKGE
ncbi:SCO family protein [Gallaecimonas sp. GXIMD4217]|uniref:SCO family protein n=1 Tax=Gallaecimonas sp. GXIMD4217 TaxID=3131927 RepID=UPI00311AEBEA